MMYQPDEDPFLMIDESNSISGPPGHGNRNLNYQYQPQSMYQIPVGQAQPQQAYPQNYPPNAQPRRMRPKPSMYAANGAPIMPPVAPVIRATPSFYGEPMVGQPVIGQPYVVPNQQYGYVQPVPAPIYVQNNGGVYRDNRGYMLHDQVDELNRYQSSRPRNYNNGPDSSLLIATLVSEQDAMYGTNMLENLTPADLDHIQSLMGRGVPEHEAYRLAFDRKPHVVLPPKVPGETTADKRALEDAIQLSLTESSRRASRPDAAPGSDRADQEALEKAIQLSLQESQNQSRPAAAYSSGYSSGYTTSSNTHVHAPAPPPNTYRSDEASYTGSDDGYSRSSAASSSRPYDRQYPYNLTNERPAEALSRTKPVNQMTEEDYAKARLLREAEDIRARAYGGGSGAAVNHTAELFPSYPRPYPSHAAAAHQAQQYQQQQYRAGDRDRDQFGDSQSRDDDYTVDSRESRSIDNRSQYSYDRHDVGGRPEPGRYGQSQQQQGASSAYTTTTHLTVHRTVPAPYPVAAPPAYSAAPYAPSFAAPQPYSSQYGSRPQSPPHYRTEDVDYDSNSDEGKDDHDQVPDFRRGYAQQSAAAGNKVHSRSSNYTSTSSISLGDDVDQYSPRDPREAGYKGTFHSPVYRPESPPSYRAPSPAPGSGGMMLANMAVASDSAHYYNNERSSGQSVGSATTRTQNVTRSRAASPAVKGPLARIPSFTAPGTSTSATSSSTSNNNTNNSNSVTSPGPSLSRVNSFTNGSPGPSLSRVPSFSAPRTLPPAPSSTRLGIANANSESSDNIIIVNSKVSSSSITARTDRTDNSNATNTNNHTSTSNTTSGAEGAALPQHEWRKTLTRLVSKLTIDSDED